MTPQENESLNIEYHKKRLILKAFQLSKTTREASNKLGVSIRTCFKLKVKYNIKKR